MRFTNSLRVIALLLGGIVAGITSGCDRYDYGCSEIEADDSELVGFDILSVYPDATEICVAPTDDECWDSVTILNGDGEVLRTVTLHVADCDTSTDTAVDTGGDTSVDTADTGGTDTATDTGDTAEPIDADGDGAIEGEDCDDTDATLNLDDTDSDGYTTCDGDCDDSDAGMSLSDGDGDGYSTCTDDCDDGDDTVYPGAEEICGDGIDQDCDSADEECEEVCADDLGEELSWLCVDDGMVSMAYDELTWDQADDYVGTWSDPDMSEIAVTGIGIDSAWGYSADNLVDYDDATGWFGYEFDTIGWYRVNFRSEAAWAYFADYCSSTDETSVLCYEDTSGRWSLMFYFDGLVITY